VRNVKTNAASGGTMAFSMRQTAIDPAHQMDFHWLRTSGRAAEMLAAIAAAAKSVRMEMYMVEPAPSPTSFARRSPPPRAGGARPSAGGHPRLDEPPDAFGRECARRARGALV